jgi:hypothetical protein
MVLLDPNSTSRLWVGYRVIKMAASLNSNAEQQLPKDEFGSVLTWAKRVDSYQINIEKSTRVTRVAYIDG